MGALLRVQVLVHAVGGVGAHEERVAIGCRAPARACIRSFRGSFLAQLGRFLGVAERFLERTALSAAQRIDHQRERRRRLPTTGVVQEESRKRLAPLVQHTHEATFLDVRCEFLFRQTRNAKPSQRSIHDVGRRVEDELPIDAHVQLLAASPGWPARRGSSRVWRTDRVGLP